jgi:phosphonate transport system ATP-binding protein
MLEVRAVTRMFGQKAAVDNVSFSIDRPAFVGIIGRSGAGKSTFLRLMNRLIDASSGEILVDGRNVLALRGAEARAWQSHCAMIFQQFNLVPRMDVASNVLHGILNRRRTGAETGRGPLGRSAATGRHRAGAHAGSKDHPGRRTHRKP